MIRNSILLIALAVSAVAQDSSPSQVLSFLQAIPSGRSDSDYESGLRALDARQWAQAIVSFDASVARKGSVADGALYWKAYAQNRAGRPDEALATIAALRHSYPSSRWIKDAKALEVEV